MVFVYTHTHKHIYVHVNVSVYFIIEHLSLCMSCLTYGWNELKKGLYFLQVPSV